MLFRNTVLAFALCASAAAEKMIRCEVVAKEPDSYRIEIIEGNLRKLPEYIIDRLNNFGGKVVIFGGRLTDLAEWSDKKGKTLADGRGEIYHSDLVPGAYDPASKTAYINQMIDEMTVESCSDIHEIGHMTDHAYGLPPESEAFRNAVEKDVSKVYFVLRYSSSFRKDFSQTWTEGFKQFYCISHAWPMKKFWPNVYEYFQKFDAAAREK